jgi:hypothetical protein
LKLFDKLCVGNFWPLRAFTLNDRPRAHMAAEEETCIARQGARTYAKECVEMTYRVYSGPPGSEIVPPLEKERWLYKEFGLLDEALGWARHVNDGGRVAVLIEGDDGTQMSKREISAALQHPERAGQSTASH